MYLFSSSDVFDVYRPAKDHVLLLDFNPFGERTDGLLFSWSELQQSEDEGQSLSRVRELLSTYKTNKNTSSLRNISSLTLLTFIYNSFFSPQIIEDEINELRIESLEDSNTLQYNDRNLTDSNRHTPPRDAFPEFRFIADATGVQPSPYM